MTIIDVYVKKEIEVPDSVTIKGVTSKVDWCGDLDFDEEYTYSYYSCHVGGDDIGVNDRDYEIRIYDQSSNGEVYIAAVVDNEIVEDCYVRADSSPVKIAIRSLEKLLNEYKE